MSMHDRPKALDNLLAHIADHLPPEQAEAEATAKARAALEPLKKAIRAEQAKQRAKQKANTLEAAAQQLYTVLFPAVYDDLGQKAAEGVNRAVGALREMARQVLTEMQEERDEQEAQAHLNHLADELADEAQPPGVVRLRKRPVEVDTIQWTGDNEAEVQAFTGGPSTFYALSPEDREGCDDPEATAAVFDKLHSTWVLVYVGNRIVRGVKGEYYPIAADVLAETYEPVSGPS